MCYFLPPICSPLPSLLFVALPSPWPAPVQLQNNVFFFSQHIQRIHSLCHELFMHYTSFLNNLSSHLSIFPPLPPSVSASLSSVSLKAFHLSTISTPGHTSPPFDSILIFPSIFLHLFFSYPSSLSFCPATSRILPPCALYPLPLRPPAQIKPRAWPDHVSHRGPATRTQETDLEKQDKVHQNCSGFTAPWAVYIFGYRFTFLHSPHPAPPSLSVCVSLPPSVLLRLSFPSSSDRHCRSLDSEASLQ